jgi:hypothetical protein
VRRRLQYDFRNCIAGRSGNRLERTFRFANLRHLFVAFKGKCSQISFGNRKILFIIGAFFARRLNLAEVMPKPEDQRR